ncbi:MAG: 5'-methylthioadenosine phosphorylase [Verrucomicrobiales bacterium]|jgi:5'-methylthioadenosine phosphorylase
MMLALITGSGFYDIDHLQDWQSEEIETDFGVVTLSRALWDGRDEVVFIARHGSDHSIAPHLINYRANVAALHSVGVTAILATAVSGGIADGLEPGALVLIDDFLDFTNGRSGTFFDSPGTVQHTDMTTAYDPELRNLIAAAAVECGVALTVGGTYCTFNGPRFETPSEIRMAKMLGGDLVGMTGYPEVVLARELGMAYGSIGVISNRAAGLGGGDLSIEDIMSVLNKASEPLYQLIGATIDRYYSSAPSLDRATSRMYAGEEIPGWKLTTGDQ